MALETLVAGMGVSYLCVVFGRGDALTFASWALGVVALGVGGGEVAGCGCDGAESDDADDGVEEMHVGTRGVC